MIDHIFKVSPAAFSRLQSGVKTYELVAGDRDIQSGDKAFLCEYDTTVLTERNCRTEDEKKRRGEERGYTGKRLSAVIGTVESLDSWTVVSLLSVIRMNDVDPLMLEETCKS